MVRLALDVANKALELIILFQSKNGFKLVEFEAIGGLFTRLSKVVNAADGEKVDIGVEDIKLLISTVDVCSRRVPVEVANFRTIADLLDVLDSASKEVVDYEETKTDL